MLGRDRNAGAVIAAPFAQRQRPAGEPISAPESSLQHCSSAQDEQRPQVPIAVSSDPPKARLSPGRVLLRCETEPGGELSTILELMSFTHARDDRRCSDGSQAAQLLQA